MGDVATDGWKTICGINHRKIDLRFIGIPGGINIKEVDTGLLTSLRNGKIIFVRSTDGVYWVNVGQYAEAHKHLNNIIDVVQKKRELNDKHEFTIHGFEAIKKTATASSSSSSRIYVPNAWNGCEVIVIRISELG